MEEDEFRNPSAPPPLRLPDSPKHKVTYHSFLDCVPDLPGPHLLAVGAVVDGTEGTGADYDTLDGGGGTIGGGGERVDGTGNALGEGLDTVVGGG